MTPLVVRIEDLQTGAKTQFAFIKSPVRIGRSELNDLPLAQGFVSQWHAVVQFDENEIRYVDLGSTNGSIVDGARLGKNQAIVLAAGTAVVIGALKLTLERRATGEHRAPAPRTQFAIRAATVMRAAVKPGTAAAAAAAGPAPRPGPATKGSTATGMPAVEPALPAQAAPLAAPPPDAAALAAIAEALATPLGEAPPPLAAPAAEPLPPVAAAVVEQALEAASLDLDLLYASYRGSWEHMRARVEEVTAGMDAASRDAAVRRLAEKYPAVLQEAQFRGLGGGLATAAPPSLVLPSLGAAPAAPHRPPAPAPEPVFGASDSEQLLSAFAESYLPASTQVRTPDERQAFLGRVAEALETFGRSFVEMRKGYEEFGKQMGVRTVHGEGPVQRARDPRQLLAALLDPAQQGRTEELQAAFADYMVHQVAILNGVTEGAKALLGQLDPQAIESGAPQSMWPMKGQALWKTFEERFHALLDEEDAISDALFGREFGRAYTSIVGQRGGGPGKDDDEDEEDEAPPARQAKAKAKRR